VVFSCVILEPTYNHGREGRGNSVAEGKSAGTRHLSELWVEKQIKELLDASASRRLRVGVPRRGPDAYLDGAVHGSAVRVLVSPRRARAARVSSLRARASGAAAERRAHSRRTGWRRFFFSRALNWEVKSLVTLFLLETLSRAGELICNRLLWNNVLISSLCYL